MKITKDEAAPILRNWNTVAAFLKEADVETVRQLLQFEMRGRKRIYIAERLFTRAATLTMAQKKDEFLRKHWPEYMSGKSNT